MDEVDLAALEAEMAAGNIIRALHPTLDLAIYNYTAKAQYGRHWNEYTLMCRGLVLNSRGSVVARPLPKFFNVEEHPGPLPDEPFEVFEKVDGSLIIIASYKGEVFVASRGSFTSPYAAAARRIIATKYPALPSHIAQGKTYLFELIFPQGRIVVDYGDTEELIALAVLDTESGRELPLENIGPPLVERHNFTGAIKDLPVRPNAEGYVLRFANGLRLKVKHPEYVHLHRVLSGVSSKDVFEWLRLGRPFEQLAERIPDEFHPWLRKTAQQLEEKFSTLLAKTNTLWEQLGIDEHTERSVAARKIQTADKALQPALFQRLSGKDPSPFLWKMVTPSSKDEGYWPSFEAAKSRGAIVEE